MKPWGIATLFIIGVGLPLRQGWSRPVDLSAPSGELGAANSKGYLEIWREIDDVGLQLGKGSFLPLRYKFTTDPTTGGILGSGFYMPMFEAKNVLIRESTMRAYLPCGKGLYMWRDNVDPNKFRSVDDQWTGYLTGDDYVVWRDDGWKVQYHKSRLSSITADDGHVFTWSYDQSGLPQGVSENGQTLITVEPNAAGQINAIISNGKRYELQYAERPITEMLLGQVGIKELDQALSGFKYPDGTADTFNFVLRPDRVPTLGFTSNDKQQVSYTWNPANDYLATEKGTSGDWTYKVGEITQDFGTPSISRTDTDGKSESVAVDNTMGIYTQRMDASTVIVTHIFETPGPLYHKVQKIEKTAGNITTQIYRASYDEAGRLTRKVDANNIMTTIAYDAQGKETGRHISVLPDPKVLAALTKQEQVLLNELQTDKGTPKETSALQDLAVFYISKELDFQKASLLLPLATDKEQIYNLKLLLAISDPQLSSKNRNSKLAQLVDEFPEKKAYTENLMTKESE